MKQENVERRGMIVEYGPDEVGYVADTESNVCIGFSRAELEARQGSVPKIGNGSHVLYRLDELGHVAQIGLDLMNLAQGLKS